MPRSRLAHRLIIFGILAVPVTAFLILQAVSAYTRSGTVSELWLLTGAQGQPVALALDGINVGVRTKLPNRTEGARNDKMRWRLVLVDLRTGERLAREPVEVQQELFAVADGAWWFRALSSGEGAHARSASDLSQVENAGPAPAEQPLRHPPLRTEVTVEGLTLQAKAGDGFAVDQRTGELVRADGDVIRVTHQPPVQGQGEALWVARVSADGTEKWRTALERQRILLGATKDEGADAVALVAGGAAKDFAFSLSLTDGALRFVHSF